MAKPDGSRPDYGFSPVVAIAVAAKRLRGHIPASDQRMHLLRVLLERLETHARTIQNPTIVIHQEVLDEIAYDEWAEGRSRERGGQHDAPIQAETRRLVQYWKKILGTQSNGSSFEIEEIEGGFATTQEVVDPDRGATRIRFSIRSQPEWLSITASDVEDALEDTRTVLQYASTYRPLHTASQSLLAAFRRTTKDAFSYSGDACKVTVQRNRPIMRRPATWIAALAIFILPVSCAWVGTAYVRTLNSVRKQMFNVAYGMRLATDCDHGVPRVRVAWGRRAPSTWVTSLRLLRNGVPIANVEGKTRYTDSDVLPGRTYNYSLAITDFFGRIVVADPAMVRAVVQCDSSTFVPPIAVSPRSGTWDTVFTFTATPPPADGAPSLYSWNRRGSQWNARTQEAFEEWSARTADHTLQIKFTPCDHCVQHDMKPDGTVIKLCSVDLSVLMLDGREIEYTSPRVTIIDAEQWECRDGAAWRPTQRFIRHDTK